MSVNYASGLSPYEHKGRCGMKEIFDPLDVLEKAIEQLAKLISASEKMVVITGAGVSTSAGIPDFRGPKGVWTLEEKGEAPDVGVTFETARPTATHMALVALEKAGKLHHLISQNVDGLHARSGFPLNKLSELHGNMFVEECDVCKARFFMSTTVPTMARRYTGSCCQVKKQRGNCRGKMRDTILDWEDELPVKELLKSEEICRQSDLCICLGTSLQILPCGNMPLLTRKNGGKVVAVNLQKTRIDNKCDLRIHAYVDDVMVGVCKKLQIEIPEWYRPVVFPFSLNGDREPVKRNSAKVIVDDSLVYKVDQSLEVNTKGSILCEDGIVEKEEHALEGKGFEKIPDGNADQTVMMDIHSEQKDTLGDAAPLRSRKRKKSEEEEDDQTPTRPMTG